MKSWILILSIVACTNDVSRVERLLRREGYTQIVVGGYSVLGCGDDAFSNHFSARKNGEYVQGYVCSGWGKGTTIRIND